MILFEDDHIIAVNKPEGLASIPERNPRIPSLLSRLTQQREHRIYVVHRLDKDVSGVILFAKTADAHRCLSDQFSRHLVEKRYVALVRGELSPDRGSIRRPIREFGSGRMGVDDGRGKPAHTAYEVMERLAGFTFVRIAPSTGRRHQIRVHFYSIGHPVAGDSRYGDRSREGGIPRLMLHAARIRFRGLAGADLTVESPLPSSFAAVADRIRSESHGSASGPP